MKKTLAQKKALPNNKYWRTKADKIFMSQFHNKPCAVCNNTTGSVGHHIVPKSRSKALRYDIRNIIILCPMHHMYGKDMAPHSTSQHTVERFIEWFKVNRTEMYEWTTENERIERRYTYKQAYNNMTNGLDAWEVDQT